MRSFNQKPQIEGNPLMIPQLAAEFPPIAGFLDTFPISLPNMSLEDVMEPVLTVRNAVKRFGANKALDDVTLELQQGEWLALLGPNGAGKTTLVRAIAGRVRMASGTVSLPGGTRDTLAIVPPEV